MSAGARSRLQVVSVTSNKGGVGKTTLAANLAVYVRALREDLPVLVLNLDEQRLPERMFALEPETPGKTVLDAMRAGDLGPAIRLGEYGVHYVPSDPKVAELKAETADAFALRRVLERSGWQGLVVVDTKSDLEILTRNAIAASDLALVPVSDRSSLEEAERVFRLLEELGRTRRQARVVLSLVDLRVKYREGEHRDILSLLLAEIRRKGLPLFEGFVSRSPKIEALYTNSEGRALSVLHGAPSSLIHRQMRAIADDVLGLLDELASTEAEAPGESAPRAPGPASAQAAELHWGRRLLSVEELLGGPAAPPKATPEPLRQPREQRRHERRAYRRALPAFRTEKPSILELRSQNLSQGGLAIEPRSGLRRGDRLHVALDAGSPDEPLLVWARVVRESGPLLGLAFEPPGAATRERIAALCVGLPGPHDFAR